MSIIAWIVLGAVAGFIASKLVNIPYDEVELSCGSAQTSKPALREGNRLRDLRRPPAAAHGAPIVGVFSPAQSAYLIVLSP